MTVKNLIPTTVIVFVFMVVLLSALVVPRVYEESKAEADFKACRENGEKGLEISGVVRQAGSAYFLKTDDWHFLEPLCEGKGSTGCENNHPGVRVLRANISQPVTATICNGRVNVYTISGHSFNK